MSVIYIVLPLALLLSGMAVWAFLWATRRGQFDDLRTPALRILHDDGERSFPRKLPASFGSGVEAATPALEPEFGGLVELGSEVEQVPEDSAGSANTSPRSG